MGHPSFQAAYDKILKAKKAAQLRQKHFDSKRKKFKDGKINTYNSNDGYAYIYVTSFWKIWLMEE